MCRLQVALPEVLLAHAILFARQLALMLCVLPLVLPLQEMAPPDPILGGWLCKHARMCSPRFTQHTHPRIRMHTRAHTHTHTHTYTHTYTYTHTHIHTNAHAHAHAHAHTHAHTCTHTHIRKHVHTQTHKHRFPAAPGDDLQE